MMLVCKVCAGLLAVHMIFPTFALHAQELDVPYYTTEPEVVEGMMDMAGVGPSDYLIDLGSGDGRIVIAAAHRGAVGHGVDLDPERISESEVNARKAGVTDRVMFLEEDLFDTDFSQATVVTMFLLGSVNLRLRPYLLSRLRPGTRVLSHTFDMVDWEPDMKEVIGIRPVYLWVIPARVDGNWKWSSGGTSFSMAIEQQYQDINVSIYAGKQKLDIESSEIKGKRITLIASDSTSGVRYLFSGTAEEAQITGYIQTRQNEASTVQTWAVVRHH